ncbi:MAG: hypothetical protein RMJ33_13595 [Saprospiraceae bacterium]|nr:hypothetical protein [Saprospiraceae bacterium]MDW8230861.1 hypothetical protein [Saprospiraceae bacterium]
MRVKASSIANLTDARYFAARQVSYLGFCLEEGHPRFIEPGDLQAIRAWVEGPKIVGEFERSPAEVVREAAAFFGLDAVEVSRLELLPDLVGLEVLLRLADVARPEAAAAAWEQAQPHAAYLLVALTREGAKAVLQDAIVASTWRQLCAQTPVLIDAPLPANAMAALLEAVQPTGFAISGSAEERPGFKSFEEVDALFEALGYF